MWNQNSPGVLLARARHAQAMRGPGAPAGPAAAPAMGFKHQLAGHLAAMGKPVAIGHIHDAIDGLTQSGSFTPQQGAALKAHNGPLVGQAGQQTMGKIAGKLLS